uniref:PDZ domain-containing protein n=1 Tax=Hippocampus comes TaxID=109280 RepID=A0A3Q2XGY6_HIPCM
MVILPSSFQNPVMEETVWEQYTVTLQRDPKMGFGIAVSGGRDNPNEDSGETSIVVSDVLQGGPAEGLLFENDRVVQVNAIPMEGVIHSFAVQTLRKCGKVAKITVKRPRKVPVNLLNRPGSPDDRVFNSDYNEDYNYDQDRGSVYNNRQDHSLERDQGGYMDSGYQTRERDYDRNYDRRERGRSAERDRSPDQQYRRDGSRGRTLDRERSPDRHHRSDHALNRDYSPDRRYRSDPDRRYRSDRALNRASKDRLERSPSPAAMPIPMPRPARELEPLEKPLNVLLLKNRPNEEYGLRLGSQLFIKEMTSTGLASRDGNLQEGDIILKINGTATENLSLSDAGKLIEKSRGKLQLVVQRDRQQVLIRVPPMVDSDSELDGERPLKLKSSRSYPV